VAEEPTLPPLRGGFQKKGLPVHLELIRKGGRGFKNHCLETGKELFWGSRRKKEENLNHLGEKEKRDNGNQNCPRGQQKRGRLNYCLEKGATLRLRNRKEGGKVACPAQLGGWGGEIDQGVPSSRNSNGMCRENEKRFFATLGGLKANTYAEGGPKGTFSPPAGRRGIFLRSLRKVSGKKREGLIIQ